MAKSESRDMDIARKARTVEWLKGELLGSVVDLHRALYQGGDRDAILDALGSAIISAYALGRRLGLRPEQVDERIAGKLRLNIEEDHQLEAWYGDLSALMNHFLRVRE